MFHFITSGTMIQQRQLWFMHSGIDIVKISVLYGVHKSCHSLSVDG